MIPTLLGVTLIAFALIRMIPGDPILLMIGERGATPEVMAEMRAAYGLDKPLPVQYGVYLKNAVMGDFGTSITTKLPVR